jgi:hypothetical protein
VVVTAVVALLLVVAVDGVLALLLCEEDTEGVGVGVLRDAVLVMEEVVVVDGVLEVLTVLVLTLAVLDSIGKVDTRVV